MELAGRALILGLDPWWFLGIGDPIESMMAQVIVQQGEKQLEKYMDSLALKIRNQIAEMLNTH